MPLFRIISFIKALELGQWWYNETMNKKLLIITSFAFILSISSVNFTNAQYDIPDPTPSQVPMNAPAPVINSPRELCQYYNGRPERSIFIGAVGNPTENDCLYQISDGGGNTGYIHGYYSGNQFCMKSYGAYYNNAGIPDKTECRSVPQTITKEQQQKTPPKIVTPAKPSKTPKADDSQAFQDLFNLNNLSNAVNNAVNLALDSIRSIFDSMFDNAKKFFKIN